jgi:hypothetical protein
MIAIVLVLTRTALWVRQSALALENHVVSHGAPGADELPINLPFAVSGANDLATSAPTNLHDRLRPIGHETNDAY